MPVLYLLATGGSSGHDFELMTGAPATTARPTGTGPSPDAILPATRSAEAAPTPTTTTVAAPATSSEAAPAAPTTTAAEAVTDAPTTTAPPAAPTTTAPTAPPTTVPAPPPEETTTTTTTVARASPSPSLTSVAPASASTSAGPTHTAKGQATWFHAPDGTCAHRTLPVGTVVKVTRVYNNASTTCLVDQWGPAETSRVIDLSMDTFEKLAPPEVGVIDVILEW